MALLGETAARELWPQRREQHPLLAVDQACELRESLQLSKLRLSSVLGVGTYGQVYRT
jgi:hypothetical protein